jgi:hypothetical protein
MARRKQQRVVKLEVEGLPPKNLIIPALTRCSTKRNKEMVMLRRKVRVALMGNRNDTVFPNRNQNYSPTGK